MKRLVILLFGCLLLSGCSDMAKTSDNEVPKYKVNGGVPVDTSIISMESLNESEVWKDIMNCTDKYVSIDDQIYQIELSRGQFYNAYAINSSFVIDIYEHVSNGVVQCCTYTFSSEPCLEWYMHIGGWYIQQQVYTKEVQLIAKR